MSDPALGRAVLELTTDDTKLNAGLDKAKVGAKGLETNFKTAGQEVKAFGGQLSDLAGPLRSLAGAVGIGFSVRAVVAFGKSVFDTAGQIADMSQRLGVSVEATQGFKFAAEQAGSSIDAVGTALNKMNLNLAQGDKSTVAALKDVGLNFSAIRAMRPEDAFLAITDAIQKIEDPMEQVRVGTELMGKGFTDILPAIKAGFRDVSDGAAKMSDETVKALDDASDAWGRLADNVTIVSGTIIAHSMNAVSQITSSWRNALMFVENSIKFGTGSAAAMADAQKAAATAVEKNAAAATKSATAITQSARATTAHVTATQALIPLTTEQIHLNELLAKAKAHEHAEVEFAATAWRAWERTVSQALKNVEANSAPLKLRARDLSGIVPQVAAGGAGNMAGWIPPKDAGGGIFGSLFGSPGALGQQLSSTILGAIQGGGTPVAAAGGLVGSKIGSSIAGSLTKEGGKLFNTALGGIFSSALPVVGSLIGPLAGKLWDSLFSTKGRDTKLQMAREAFGSVEEMQRQLVTLGQAEYDRLWKQFSDVGQKNKDKAVAAVNAIVAALDAQKAKTEEVAAAAAETAQVQQDALDAITAKYADHFKAIDDEYKKLNDSVAAEAEEAEMGAQERLDRARMAELEKERAALEQQQAEEIRAKEETFDAVLAAGVDVNERLRDVFGQPLKIPYEFVGLNIPGLPVMPMAQGGYGHISSPTFFYSAGHEDYAFSGEGKRFGQSDRPIHVTVVSQLDGREVARNQVRYLPNELERLGVGGR